MNQLGPFSVTFAARPCELSKKTKLRMLSLLISVCSQSYLPR